jgi:hypothetical protein
MRNGDRDTEGLTPEPGLYGSGSAHRSRRRRQAAIGAGLVVILGGGAFAGYQVLDDDATPVARVDALDRTTPAIEQSEPGATAGMPTRTSPAAPAKTATATPRPATDAERIKAARSAAANSDSQVRRATSLNRSTVSAVEVTTSTTQQEGGTLKIGSAFKDLTGYQELGWIADTGRPVGSSRCTQKIQLSSGVAAAERPTLLLCWRISDAKSVYTVAVKPDGRPSSALSVAAIDREWARLG